MPYPALLLDVRALWHARALLFMITRRDVLARFAGAFLGWLWSYMQPILTIAVYYVVFDLVLEARFGSDMGNRSVGIYLIVGMIPWMAFVDAVSRGMSSLIESSGIIQKNPLPLVLFPARSVLASAVTYSPLFFLVAIVYSFKQPTLALIAIPVFMLLLYMLVFLLSYSLAIMAAAFRDVLQIVGFLLSLGVFVSPILFPVTMFPVDIQWLVWLNPITPMVLAMQDILLKGAWPAVTYYLIMLGWILALSGFTSVLISRSREHLADWL